MSNNTATESDDPSNIFSRMQNWRETSGNTDESISDRAKSWFGNIGDNLTDGYDRAYNLLPLNNSDIANEEPEWFKLSRFERLMGFVILILGSVACFTLGILLFPVLALKPRKFAMLWTLGSLLFVISFSLLQGPMDYIKHLLSKERLPFTLIFFGSVFSTIYCATILKSTILTLITGIIEIFSVLYYTLSYFPYGAQGFQMLTSMGMRQFSSAVGF
ncbi:unnamed protein product [[Candida] boidinii]|uniref:Protein transport protein SFT2 n=1 Tax=Candida boidinii TaxID=5477 RepID=A0A9W6WHC1_CANBO|nr:unnamed protein product [[Candida] boidinii]GMG17960.1 unnamed protein product [[Candida] boidinii]